MSGSANTSRRFRLPGWVLPAVIAAFLIAGANGGGSMPLDTSGAREAFIAGDFQTMDRELDILSRDLGRDTLRARYADVLLLRSEAAVARGDTLSGYGYLKRYNALNERIDRSFNRFTMGILAILVMLVVLIIRIISDHEAIMQKNEALTKLLAGGLSDSDAPPAPLDHQGGETVPQSRLRPPDPHRQLFPQQGEHRQGLFRLRHFPAAVRQYMPLGIRLHADRTRPGNEHHRHSVGIRLHHPRVLQPQLQAGVRPHPHRIQGQSLRQAVVCLRCGCRSGGAASADRQIVTRRPTNSSPIQLLPCRRFAIIASHARLNLTNKL